MAREQLPKNFSKRLRDLISELEEAESSEQTGDAEIELKLNEAQALWYVAYRTLAQ